MCEGAEVGKVSWKRVGGKAADSGVGVWRAGHMKEQVAGESVEEGGGIAKEREGGSTG